MELGEILTSVLAEQGWLGVTIVFIALLIWFRIWPWWSKERTKTLDHERRVSELKSQHDEVQASAFATMASESREQSKMLTRLADVLSNMIDSMAELKAITRLNGEGHEQIYSQVIALRSDRCIPEKGTLRYNLEGKIVDCNDRAPHILGTDRASLLKLDIHSQEMNVVDCRGYKVKADDLPVSKAKSLKRRQLPRLLGLTLPGGNQKWLLDSARPVMQDDEVVGMVAVFTEITEHVRLLNAELMQPNGRAM